jgi:hypothetical protein
MQDLSGNVCLPRSRAIPRRDVLRYAIAVSALPGLYAASARAAVPAAAAAPPRLIDFAMRQVPAEQI